jgi:hypothetical protein
MTRRGIITTLVALVVAAWVATADLLLPAAEPPPAAPPETATPVAGQWVCPVGDDTPATRLAVDVVRPPSEDDQSGRVEIVTQDDGEERTIGRVEIPAGRDTWFEPDGVTIVRWEGGPVSLVREWRLEGGDLPAGVVAGGCVHGLSDRWVVPGLLTSGGAEARLRVANPFRSDATVAISFLTPEGSAEPLALQNVSVGARSTLEIVVNEYLPERDDLSAIVTVAVGRVAVEGFQLMRSAIGGTDGASLLAAAPAPSEQWTVPWVVDGPNRSAWLWIANTGEREAPVELTYLTPDGGTVPDGLTEVIVEPSTMRRVDLRGTLPDGVEVVGVVARSDGAPVVVSAGVEISHPDPARSGHVVQLGAPAADGAWTFAGGATELRDEPPDLPVDDDEEAVDEAPGLAAVERDEQLHLVNPGSVTSTVDVLVDMGEGVTRPPALQSVEVPAGTRVVVDLSPFVADAAAWSATALADGPGVVAAHVAGTAEGSRRLLAVLGVPSAAWAPDGPPLVAMLTPGFTQRIATRFGVGVDGDATVDVGPPVPDEVPAPELDAPATRVPAPSLPVVPGDRPQDEIDDPDPDDEDAPADADGTAGPG